MSNKKITAITDCLMDGEKTVKAAIEYEKEINKESLNIGDFEVQGRKITDMYVSDSIMGEKLSCGRFVILVLDPDSPEADIVWSPPKPPQGPPPPKQWRAPRVVVSQKSGIKTADGSIIEAFEAEKNTKVKEPVIEDFIQNEYKGLKYNLYVPKAYDSEKKYPLVQFIGDIGANGDEVLMSLAQGNGGVVWAKEDVQSKNPCFVLVPQIPFKEIVTIDCTCDPVVDTVDEILWHITDEYSIDTERIYLTGQSQGCMTACELNLRHTGKYAASLLVAGQWDVERIGRECSGENFWIIVSEGDTRAYPTMKATVEALETNGAKVGRYIWDATWSRKELEEAAQKAAEDDVI